MSKSLNSIAKVLNLPQTRKKRSKKQKINLYSLLVFLVLMAFSYCSFNNSLQSSDQYDYWVTVLKISDGDTFRGLTDDNQEIKFRIYGIDAPEKKQAYGIESTDYLSSMISGEKVGIVVQKESDRYGRAIVWVYTPDGKDVSAEMIKSGMAWHYKAYSDSEEYAELEKAARSNKLGLWKGKKPIAPWEFRKKKKS